MAAVTCPQCLCVWYGRWGHKVRQRCCVRCGHTWEAHSPWLKGVSMPADHPVMEAEIEWDHRQQMKEEAHE